MAGLASRGLRPVSSAAPHSISQVESPITCREATAAAWVASARAGVAGAPHCKHAFIWSEHAIMQSCDQTGLAARAVFAVFLLYSFLFGQVSLKC